jgi:hypothetical protein
MKSALCSSSAATLGGTLVVMGGPCGDETNLVGNNGTEGWRLEDVTGTATQKPTTQLRGSDPQSDGQMQLQAVGALLLLTQWPRLNTAERYADWICGRNRHRFLPVNWCGRC